MRSSPSTAAEGWLAGISLRRKAREAKATRGMKTGESKAAPPLEGVRGDYRRSSRARRSVTRRRGRRPRPASVPRSIQQKATPARAAAARQAVAPGRESVEERLAEASGPAGVPLEMDEELAEALACQVGLADRAAAILLPERVVDPPVGGEDPPREREPEVGEGGAE